MATLFETLSQAQNGQAMKVMARQFGLSEQQVEDAIGALLPAFSTGLKQNTADPLGLGNLLAALAGGGHAGYFDDLQKAFQPAGINDGNGILGHIFGSKDVSREIARQASALTGIDEATLKQMLPALATTLMGGLFKQTTGQLQAAHSASAAQTDMLGQIVEQLSRIQGGRTAQRAPNPITDNPFGQVLEAMFGGGQATRAPSQPKPSQSKPSQAPDPFDNPLGKIWKDMMTGQMPQAPQPRPEARRKHPYEDILGDMLDAGKQTQDQYQRQMDSIFDQYIHGMDRLGGR